MKSQLRQQLRSRLTLWYVSMLGLILVFYVALVFVFQYASVKHQIFHDEVQDVETVEGLLSFNKNGSLQLEQNYFSHPRSHLLVDRLMEVRDLSGVVLYRSPTLDGNSLGGSSLLPGEGEDSFNEREDKLPDGTRIILISHTHPVEGRVVLIRLGYSLAPFRDRMRQFLSLLLIALPVTLAFAGVAGFLIAKRALRPLDEMATRAETISASNLNHRLTVENPDDELGHMARVLNQLLGRLEQAFTQLQRFTADAAHELRTPLASIRSVGEVSLRSELQSVEQYREVIGSILEETSVLNQTIEDLLTLARVESSHPRDGTTAFSLWELTNEVLGVLEVLTEEHDVRVELAVADPKAVVVEADRGLVRAAIMNVLHNALKFSPLHSMIRVNFAGGRANPGFAEVSFQDEGPGIRPSEREQVFDRFFTSGASETSSMSGSGIGLSIARLAIERNGGQIFFDPDAVGGARCVIRLPVSGGSTSSSVERVLPASP